MTTTAYFDPSTADTPEGLDPALAYSGIAAIPSQGTGLLGMAYAPGTGIWNLAKALEAASGTPDATFVAQELSFASKSSDTSVAAFLGDDGEITSGDGGVEMGPSALTFAGYIYIPPGTHEIAITSDDGFSLSLGDVEFISYEGSRAADTTARVAEFEGGLYKLDLIYFDAGGKMALSMEIDGLPVDQSAFHQSEDSFLAAVEAGPTIPAVEYHPSFFLGEDTLEIPLEATATDGRDVIHGMGADDTIEGLGGDDELHGG